MQASYIVIDRSLPVPLYKQLEDSVTRAIGSGILKAGDKLPTEDDLDETFNLSRPVVRQAYGSLVSAGLIVRERARGSFVKAQNYGMFANKILSFSQEMLLLGHAPATRVLEFSRAPLPSDVAGDRCASGGTWFFLERVRYTDGNPSVYLRTWIPSERFPDIENHDFSVESLYSTLKAIYDIHPIHAFRSVWATESEPCIAELLNVKTGSALSVLRSHVYDQLDKLMEVSIEYFPSPMCRFDFEVNVE
ncbi:transcriptional regulator, GntR family [Coriobacterium glomerans PW2]|uniref:Transcriptional regulator, GntR family n=1 Tax=Coriobacterium glomerans (strain ATCC 49209 / DSM 20642 / JCM 10262 / PW2) TaxID=700015 RepID=F2NB62_CORGP|nr:GntR family transcriptional regulator [Coriobacterium glomerans]AEB07813.1 transcriptional regulator, GntR family [Coriobacterium glomerans PW2]